MFQPTMGNLNKTSAEQDILKQLPDDFLSGGVTLSYQERLNLIQVRLKSLYGEMADWNRNLGRYLKLEERAESALYVKDIHSVVELSQETLVEALRLEKLNDALLQKSYESFARWNQKKNIEDLIEAAEIFGVLPTVDIKPVINDYYVNFPQNVEERTEIRSKVLHEKCAELDVVVRLIVGLYEDGQRVTFPFVRTAITQPRGKMFWRGENAFYGSSKSSINRAIGSALKNESLNVINAVVKMRQDECGLFLDNLDAVRKWNVCDVNYLALMQHYGMPTYMIDITSDLKTALFFACTKWVDDGIFGRWEPLTKSDTEKKDSRKHIAAIDGDSRYGVIYKARAEIEDLMWLTVNSRKGEPRNQEYLDAEKHVIPVGYQPFARTKAQHAYMIMGVDDLYQDSQFDKAVFRLDEIFCRWIYEEMDRGDKIYPHVDVPDISKYIQKIAKTRVFNRPVFEDYCNCLKISDKERKRLEEELLQNGYMISDKSLKFASKEEIEKINREYSVEKALELAEVEIKSMPLMLL